MMTTTNSMDTSVDRNCPKCGKVSHILKHRFDCHGTVQAQLENFRYRATSFIYSLNVSR